MSFPTEDEQQVVERALGLCNFKRNDCVDPFTDKLAMRQAVPSVWYALLEYFADCFHMQ